MREIQKMVPFRQPCTYPKSHSTFQRGNNSRCRCERFEAGAVGYMIAGFGADDTLLIIVLSTEIACGDFLSDNTILLLHSLISSLKKC